LIDIVVQNTINLIFWACQHGIQAREISRGIGLNLIFGSSKYMI